MESACPKSVPARMRHFVNPAKDREMAPTKSVQRALIFTMTLSFFNSMGLKMSLLLKLH